MRHVLSFLSRVAENAKVIFTFPGCIAVFAVVLVGGLYLLVNLGASKTWGEFVPHGSLMVVAWVASLSAVITSSFKGRVVKVAVALVAFVASILFMVF